MYLLQIFIRSIMLQMKKTYLGRMTTIKYLSTNLSTSLLKKSIRMTSVEKSSIPKKTVKALNS